MYIIYDCLSCGSTIETKQDIVFNEFIKKIEITHPKKCSCGGSFNISDVYFVDLKIKENGNRN